MELWEIIQEGDIEKLKAFLASDHDVNEGDEFGNTLLHHAARVGTREMVELLLESGANVNVMDSEEVTPLMEAVQEKREDIAKLLLDKGANPNRGRDTNGTALHYAAATGNVKIGRMLLERGAEVNAIDNDADCWTPLHSAAYNGHLEFAKLLVESGSNLYAVAGLRWPLDLAINQNHKEVAVYLYKIVEEPYPATLGSPLHAAAGLRDLDLMPQFTEYDVDVHDYASRTPLHWAVGQDRSLFFQIILEHYAQKKPFELPKNICRGNAKAAIEFLLERGAKIEAKDYEDNTPLLLALQWAQIDAAEVLIHHGAHVNVADTSGWTPVILAASGGHMRALKALVERGANLDAIRNGWNALNHACHHGKKEAAAFLLDHGMNVNGSGQRTHLQYPLFSAVFMKHTAIVRLLLDRGADVNVKGEDGKTAFSLAEGNKEIIDLLNAHRKSK